LNIADLTRRAVLFCASCLLGLTGCGTVQSVVDSRPVPYGEFRDYKGEQYKRDESQWLVVRDVNAKLEKILWVLAGLGGAGGIGTTALYKRIKKGRET